MKGGVRSADSAADCAAAIVVDKDNLKIVCVGGLLEQGAKCVRENPEEHNLEEKKVYASGFEEGLARLDNRGVVGWQPILTRPRIKGRQH